jgi:DNA repair ATPase RecN
VANSATRSGKHIGARWIRAALQVNPYGYKGANAPSSIFADEATYNVRLIAECRSQGIEMIAVTDHWCIDSALGLIKDASQAGLVVLPGFEASSSEGIHLLVIFQAGTDPTAINAAIGACGVTPSCPNGTTGDSFRDILTRMTERGALVIPAHANVSNTGMLGSRSGKPLIAMVTNPRLHAIGISPGVAEAKDQRAAVANTAPFNRQHQLATIYADDVCDPKILGNEGVTTWLKVSAPCLESLKLAVRTPSTRVSLTDPDATPRTLIRSMSWVGGFLDGVEIDLADDLTALIGGRGTGKSTVIESLRYVLDVKAIGNDAAKDHRGVVEKVLRSGTMVSVVIDTVAPHPVQFTIERSVPNPPIVKDSSGTATRLRPADVLSTLEIFGQHELAELAQDKPSVAQMVERLAGSSRPDDTYEKLIGDLRDNREKLSRTEARQSKLEQELADIPRLEDQMKRFEQSQLEQRLAQHTRLVQDEVAFIDGKGRVEEATEILREAVESDIVQTLRNPIEQISGSPDEAILQRVQAALDTLAASFESAFAGLTAAIDTASTEIEAAQSDWTTNTQGRRDSHAKVLRDLRDEGLDPDKFIATKTALEKLKSKVQQRKPLTAQVAALLDERQTLLGKLASAEAAQSKSLNASIRTANKATNGTVVVKPIPSPDRKHIHAVIDHRISRQRTQITAAVDADNFSPRAFAAAARLGAEEMERQYGIHGAQLASVMNAGEVFYREMEELRVGQAVDVTLDVSPDGQTRDYRRLEDLSKGQRATALLLLLLGVSTGPLIIDQPEDDLDNRFVYDGVVQELRKLKGKRQVIVSTHNANVPVLGDAELIITLEGNGTNGWPMQGAVGSLDDAKVREQAEHLLEGGRTAFDARHHLYGF